MTPLNWGVMPNCAAPLSYLNNDRLVTYDGRPVSLTFEGMDFVVRVDGVEVIRTGYAIQVCYKLNQYEVGLKK